MASGFGRGRRGGPGQAEVVQILGGVEFAAKGFLQEINLADFGYKPENFWTGALKSVTWNNKIYGIPTNNETMAFIWNKQIFADAGLDLSRIYSSQQFR